MANIDPTDDATKGIRVFRDFKAKLPVLKTLGIEDYDSAGGLDKLIFDIRSSIKDFQRQWKTLDSERIEKLIKLCITREL